MSEKKKVTMDRVGELTRQINDDWTEINNELQRLCLIIGAPELKDVHKRLDILRCEYANLILFAQEEVWPFLAEANGWTAPDEDK